MRRSLTVVGGGLAGAMLATHLGMRGHAVTVYESRPDLRTTDIDAGRSINLALATRGIAALEELGLMGTVAPLLTAMRGRMVHALDGSQSLQPYGNRPHEVIHSVSRSDLNAVLLDAAEATGNVEVRFNQRCIDGSAIEGSLRFRDYLTADEYRVDSPTTFGTDGSASAVRDFTIAEGGGEVSIEPLDHGYKELVLPAAPDGSPLLDEHALHIWPRGGFMLIALVNMDNSFTCTLFVPETGHPYSLEALREQDTLRELFDSEFPDFAALMPDLEREYAGNPEGHLGTVRCRGWHVAGKSLILGDAAHGIVPFHGQGMNAAFESCSLLMRALDRYPEDWAGAFAAFEAERKPDVDAIADMALDNYVEMRSSVADPGYQLKRELALELERRWPEHFTPRYALVMFTTIPYAEAQARAREQAAVLDALTVGINSFDEVDFEHAAQLVEQLAVRGD